MIIVRNHKKRVRRRGEEEESNIFSFNVLLNSEILSALLKLVVPETFMSTNCY